MNIYNNEELIYELEHALEYRSTLKTKIFNKGDLIMGVESEEPVYLSDVLTVIEVTIDKLTSEVIKRLKEKGAK